MIRIRRAKSTDSADLFQWRNDVGTRAASISTDIVEWTDHNEWLATSLESQSRWLYIALAGEGDDAARLGMCRFDLGSDGASVEVSINLNPDYRGRGLAVQILSESIRVFRDSDDHGKMRLTATIRPDNRASTTTFERLGFQLMSTAGGFDHYVLRPVTALLGEKIPTDRGADGGLP